MHIEPTIDDEEPKIELRVLYGPQSGSRLPLSTGEYVLGSSDECAIILSGPRMEEEHALLVFDGARPSIAPVNGKVCDAQGNAITEALPLSLGMPVELGGVWLCFDYVDALWPDPATVAPITNTAPVNVPEVIPTADSNDNQQSTSAEKSEGKIRLRAKSALIFSIAVLTMVAISGVAVAAWLVQKNHAPATTSVKPVKPFIAIAPAKLEEIKKIVASVSGRTNIIVSLTPENKVLVQGYVENAAVANQLDAALSLISPNPLQRIFIESEILESAAGLLKEKLDPSRIHIIVSGISNGTLSIEGSASTSSVRDEAIDLLRVGVTGVTEIESLVVLTEDLPALLQEKISSARLARRLQIIEKQPEFIVRGSLTADEFVQWEKLLFDFDAAFGKMLPIRAKISLLEKKPPVNLQTIVGGIAPFITTENGDRITRGGDINGHTLVIVRDNEVIFDGGERFKIAR